MSHPAISIIIPHYDSVAMLVRAINSVPTREDVEVIAVDNSKAPVKAEDLKGATREYKLVYSPYGKGAGCARNVGLDNAKGDYVIFMDADDMLSDVAGDIIDDYLRSTDKADITYYHTLSVYNDTGARSPRADLYNKHLNNCIKNPSPLNKDRLRFYHLTPWGKIYSREVIDRSKARFDEVPASNDLYFCTSVALTASDIKADARSLYIVTSQQKGTLTTTPSRNNSRSRHSVLLRQSNLFKRHGKTQFSSMPTVMLRTLLKISVKDFCWGVAEIMRHRVNPLVIAYNKYRHHEFK